MQRRQPGGLADAMAKYGDAMLSDEQAAALPQAIKTARQQDALDVVQQLARDRQNINNAKDGDRIVTDARDRRYVVDGKTWRREVPKVRGKKARKLEKAARHRRTDG